ncbi:MAG: hypothetical protein M3Z04_13225 [Chloroflexota bacterium]|nr:hypothetical protein [Chloroflexota bacterium]
MSKEALLQRLDAIGRSVADTGHARALLALGSVGTEQDRLDAYSDLDFFVVVQDGYEVAYRADLAWLRAVWPIGYCFQNTLHGYKLLFADGIYAEFAVFSETELAQMTFPAARIVWKAAGVADSIRLPQRDTPPSPPRPPEALLGELLTNLYVGVGRYRRGERLSAARLIQGYAVDRLVELAPHMATAETGHPDTFGPERRFEQRFPRVAQALPSFMQGYDRSPESAAALLTFVAQHWTVDPAIEQAIRALLPDPLEGISP